MYQEICPKSNMICPLIYKIIQITATLRKKFFRSAENFFLKSSSYLNDFVYKRTNHIWFRTNFSVHGKNRKCAENTPYSATFCANFWSGYLFRINTLHLHLFWPRSNAQLKRTILMPVSPYEIGGFCHKIFCHRSAP